MNELILLVSVVVIYGSVLLAYRLFGKSGLFAFTVVATVLANIEVLILVDAFGMEQTLGYNVPTLPPDILKVKLPLVLW